MDNNSNEICGLKGITVYCASSKDIAPEYYAAARKLGQAIAAAGFPLITGAGNMGLMGAVNDAAMEAGGCTVGVIPRFMVKRGWHHDGLSKLIVTEDMHSRKSLMASLARGVVALPGGIGTLEELCEIMTWRQLGLFDGSVVIYNVDGYYDPLTDMLRRAIDRGFMRSDHAGLFAVATDASEAVRLAAGEHENHFSPKF